MTEAEFDYRFMNHQQQEIDTLSYDLSHAIRIMYQKLGSYKTKEIIAGELETIEGREIKNGCL
jgi:hypothetical protein